MASTHLSLHYHLVFRTKNREPWLSPTHRQRVHEYIGGILRNKDGVADAVGGTGDHIHIAAGLRATHCLADVMREVKSESSRWIHEELRLRFVARNSDSESVPSRNRNSALHSPIRDAPWQGREK